MIKTRLFLVFFFLSFSSWAGWFRYGNTMPEWLSIILSIWNWLVGPVVVIAVARLAKEELDFEDPRGFWWVLVRILVGTPLGFFGLVFIATGLGLMGFALWKMVSSGDATTFHFFSAFGLLSLGVVLGGQMIFGVFRRSGPTRQEIVEERRIREERLGNPDWGFYEKHLCRPVPAILRERYGKPDEFVLSFPDGEDFEAVWSPIHPAEVVPALETKGEMELLPFASGSEGGFLFLMPGVETRDGVFLADTDEADHVSRLFATAEEFFATLRESSP